MHFPQSDHQTSWFSVFKGSNDNLVQLLQDPPCLGNVVMPSRYPLIAGWGSFFFLGAEMIRFIHMMNSTGEIVPPVMVHFPMECHSVKLVVPRCMWSSSWCGLVCGKLGPKLKTTSTLLHSFSDVNAYSERLWQLALILLFIATPKRFCCNWCSIDYPLISARLVEVVK